MNTQELSTEQKLADACGKLSQSAFIILFFRDVLPKAQGDAILRAALEIWNQNNPEPSPLPDNWVVYEGDK